MPEQTTLAAAMKLLDEETLRIIVAYAFNSEEIAAAERELAEIEAAYPVLTPPLIGQWETIGWMDNGDE